MAKWTKQQIEIFARSAGFGARSADAAEVAMAESAGDDKVVNSIGCVGLMQINQPVHVGAHPKWTRKWLQDPINNMEAALVLYKAAGNKWDGPWLDSRDKGSGGGWGGKVSGSSGGTRQAADDPCAGFILPGMPGDGKDHPLYKKCQEENGGGGEGYGDPLGIDGIKEVATQLGRLAQAVAKAGNWLAEPKNWVRVAYVGGGAALGLVALNIVMRPYTTNAFRQVAGALPVQTTKRVIHHRQAEKSARAEAAEAERKGAEKKRKELERDTARAAARERAESKS